MLRLWDKPLTEEERKEIAEKIAREIKKRKLEAVAILALEMHKPLANVAGHAALAFSPFLIPVLGFQFVDRYSQFISERENIETLIRLLEQTSPEEKGGENS